MLGHRMNLEQWKESGRTFSYGGHNIFYRDDGGGDVLLCIHGFPTASWDWQKIWEPLRQRFRLVAPDMIGFGFSGRGLPIRFTIRRPCMKSCWRSSESTPSILAHDYGDSVARSYWLDTTAAVSGEAGLTIRSACF
jgi:pimeloyl-ACP methyl ester carboxylesterase